ncbi:LLM class flavin-dependent oxidoreductase [Bacillus anthracis]|uniref:LLM class flavin-dependent oxidoreductase n=2 Tax=Bacillus cereus group TaxID=86661 RepID=UPI00387EE08E
MHNVIRDSEVYNNTGTLVYYSNRQLDPWMLTTSILNNTEKLIPLVAAQPYSQPPFTTASMVQSLSLLYNRKVNLNFIIGSTKSDHLSIDDQSDHNQRYERLAEYMEVVKLLLSSSDSVSFKGDYYNIRNLAPKSEFDSSLMPEFFVAGSSSASKELAIRSADVLIVNPAPYQIFKDDIANSVRNSEIKLGVAMGIITRPTSIEAWKVARDLFPITRKTRAQILLKRNAESSSVKQLTELALKKETYDEVYWLGAFLSGRVVSPYLVGSYSEVADYIKKYVKLGVENIVLNGPFDSKEFYHRDQMFQILNSSLNLKV